MRILSSRRNFEADHSSSTCEFFALHGLTSEQREAVKALTGESARRCLVQMALHLLRAEVWAPEGRRGLYRVTARRAPNHALREGRFRRLNVGEVEAALAAATDKGVSDSTQERLQAVWPNVEDALRRSLEARMADRVGGMERLLQERADKEAADIEAVLTELARAIEEELAAPEWEQLDLWSLGEREQLRKDIAALEMRLTQIPGEIEAEQAVIYARYADPQPRMFPVAVTFLVPERLDR